MRSTAPPDDLAGFPTTTWRPGQGAHRVYRHTDPETGEPRTPLYFASGSGAFHEGRWDLPAPDGACYLADDVAVCILEAVAADLVPGSPSRLASDAWLRQRRQVPVSARATSDAYAQLGADGAFGFGVAGDLHTTEDRALTQGWAAALCGHGQAGLRAHARTPPGGDHGTWTLFGPAGPASQPPDTALELGPSESLHDDAELLRRLERLGVSFLPAPNDVPAD